MANNPAGLTPNPESLASTTTTFPPPTQNQPIGLTPAVPMQTPATSTTTPTDPQHVANNAASAASAAPTLSPSAVVGIAQNTNNPVDAAIAGQSTAAATAGAKVAKYLQGTSTDYQNSTWNVLSQASKELLSSVGYRPPTSQTAPSGGWWHDALSMADSVGHSALGLVETAGKALMHSTGAAINDVMAPVNQAERAFAQNAQLTIMRASSIHSPVARAEALLGIANVGAIARNWNEVANGSSSFQPAALAYVQTQLGITGPTFQLLKAYVEAGGQGQSALQSALQSVPANERANAATMIEQNAQFQKAADLLNNSHLSLGNMIMGGLNASQWSQIEPWTKTGAFQGAQSSLDVAGTAGAGAVALASGGTLATAGILAGGAVGTMAGALEGKTAAQASEANLFNKNISIASGVIDGTSSWYLNPLFLGANAYAKINAAVHGVASLDALSSTKVLDYYTRRGAGQRFVQTLANAVVKNADGSAGISHIPNFSAVEKAGINTKGLTDIINEWYPKIAKATAEGKAPQAVVSDMMASDNAYINILRGNAGQLYHGSYMLPRITVPDAAINAIKNFASDTMEGTRFNVSALSPRQIASKLIGEKAAAAVVSAAGDEERVGMMGRLYRRAVTIAPSPVIDVTKDESWIALRDLLKTALPESYISRTVNFYRSLPLEEIAARRQIFQGAIKDLLYARGLGETSGGQDYIDKWMTRENYSHGENAMWKNPNNLDAPAQPGAILDNQISHQMRLPDEKKIAEFAKKNWLMKSLGMVANNDFMEHMMSKYWRPAMILRPAFALRVSAEEALNFMMRHSVASYTNARIAASLFDAANGAKEMTKVEAFKASENYAAYEKELSDKMSNLSYKGTLGSSEAQNLRDLTRMRQIMQSQMPPEIADLIKTPEQLLASIHGWGAINMARRLGLKMVPKVLLDGAYALAKHGVLETGFADHLDAVLHQGTTYFGDMPTDIWGKTEEGQRIRLSRGDGSVTTPRDSPEFMQKLQVQLRGITDSEIATAAVRGYKAGGRDVAIQHVEDYINGTHLDNRLETALKDQETFRRKLRAGEFSDPEHEAAQEAIHEMKVKRAEEAIRDRKIWKKNFYGDSQTRDGRSVKFHTGTKEQATRDWANAVVDHVEKYTHTHLPQESVFDKASGEMVKRPSIGLEPIILDSRRVDMRPFLIKTRDEGRAINHLGSVEGSDVSEEENVLLNKKRAYERIPDNHIRLFRGENTAASVKNGELVANPGRDWTPSVDEAVKRAGEGGRVYSIDVPDHVLMDPKKYDFRPADAPKRGEEEIPRAQAEPQEIQAIKDAQNRGVSRKGATWESGEIRRNGDEGSQRTLLGELAEKIVPPVEELDKVDLQHWPSEVKLPETIMKVDGAHGLVGKAIEKGSLNFVAKPINYFSRQPLFVYNFSYAFDDAVKGMASRGIPDVDHLLAHDIAFERAVNETLPFVHNTEMKSYLSIAMRNIAPFWFAQEQFYKRWGKLFGAYPEAWYKLSQTVTGLKSVGFLYTDQYGKTAFMWPGSSIALEWLDRLSGINVQGVGFSSELGGLNPTTASGDVIPIPSLGPLTAVPLTIAGGIWPRLSSLANAVRGAQAQPVSSTQWPIQMLEEMSPSIANRLFSLGADVVNFDNSNVKSGMMTSAMIMAGQYLERTGHGLSVEGQNNAGQKQAYIDRLRNWGELAILFRSMFGMFAPATPNIALNSNADGQLYQTLLNTMPYDEAFAEFMKLRPNATADTVFASTTSGSDPQKGSGTYVPATAEALTFLHDNPSFVQNYSQLAPWAMPTQSTTALFNSQAYTQEKALLMRNPVSINEWYDNVKYAEAANTYYPLEQLVYAAQSPTAATSVEARATLGITQAQAQAQLGWQNQSETQMKAEWRDWAHGFMLANPVFASIHTLKSSESSARRLNIINELQTALSKGDLPQNEWSDKVSGLMIAFDKVYNAYYPGKGIGVTGVQATENKQAFLTWGTQYAKLNPVVAPFWNGVLSKQVP